MDIKTGSLSEGCPFNDNVKPRTLLGRTNRDWWPDSLAVEILHYGGISPDPMGRE